MSLGITQGQIDSGLPLFPFVTPVGNNIWTRKIQQMSKVWNMGFCGLLLNSSKQPKSKMCFQGLSPGRTVVDQLTLLC